MINRRAETRPIIAFVWNFITGEGDHAFNERLIVNDGAFYGKGGSYVLHEHANAERTLAARHFHAGQHLD